MNAVYLMGNLGQTPQLREVKSGKPVLNFSLAVDETFANKDRSVSTTNWFDITVWGPEAQHQSKHLTKGSKVIVEGHLNVRHYIDRHSIPRQKVEIIASKITWVDLKELENEQQAPV